MGKRRRKEWIIKKVHNRNMKHVRLFQILEKIYQERGTGKVKCKFKWGVQEKLTLLKQRPEVRGKYLEQEDSGQRDCIVTELCDLHHNPFQNTFFSPERNIMLINSHFPFPLSHPAPGNH